MPPTAAPTNNKELLEWVDEVAALTQPDAIQWCDGSQAEYDQMFELMLASGTAQKLDKRPGSYLVLSDPADVARVEDRTFICSAKEEDAGPNNNWCEPAERWKASRTTAARPLTWWPSGPHGSNLPVASAPAGLVSDSTRRHELTTTHRANRLDPGCSPCMCRL